MHVSHLQNYSSNRQKSLSFNALCIKNIDDAKDITKSLKYRLKQISPQSQRKMKFGQDEEGNILTYLIEKVKATEEFWKNYYTKIQKDNPIREIFIVDDEVAHAHILRFERGESVIS